MLIDEVLTQARDTMTVRRVFGEPIERDGLTVIPVANVMGGGGGGGGEGPVMPGDTGDRLGSTVPGIPQVASGSGAGFAVRATPAGAYVIKDGEVHWEPAVDMTRVIVMGQIVGIIFLLVMRSILRSRR
jgi:uncharacterized spore protein YtfJ